MKGKNFLILVVLAAIIVGYAVVSSRKQEAAPPDMVGKSLLPDLQVNDIEKIVVRSQDATSVLARVNDIWVAPDRYNYPANFEKIKRSLLKLADIKIGQVVNVDDKQKAQIRMLAPPASTNEPGGQSGVVIDLIGKGYGKLASLLVGDTHRRKGGEQSPMGYGNYPDAQYVSTDGGKNVYLIKETLDDFPSIIREWLDTELTSVPDRDVSEVTMVSTNGETLKLTRSKDTGKLALDGITDKEEVDNNKLSGIESALSYLRFDNVADPAVPPEKSGLDKPAIYKAVTTTGESYTMKIGAEIPGAAGRYVKIEASFIEPVVAATTNAAATNTEATAQSKETEKKIKSVNERLGKWIYVVGTYKTDAMMTLRKDLIKKKEEPKAEAVPPEPKKKENLTKEEAPKIEPVKATESPQNEVKKESQDNTNAVAPRAENKPASPASNEKKSGGWFRWFKKSGK